jgi:hypothetical protein
MSKRHVTLAGLWVLLVAVTSTGHAQPVDSRARIEGRVTYENGRPAAGVQVRAKMQTAAAREILTPAAVRYSQQHPHKHWVFPKEMLQIIEAVVTTRPDGTYSFEGLAQRPYNIMVVNEPVGWVAVAAQGIVAREQGPPRCKLVLTHGAVIRGTVIDESNGDGLPNVRLWLTAPHRPESSNNLISLRTDKSGRFVVRVAPGKTSLAASATAVEHVPDVRTREGIEVGIVEVGGVAYLQSRTVEVVLSKGQHKNLLIGMKRFTHKRK